MDQLENPDILRYKTNIYHDAILESESLPTDLDQFDKMLTETMKHLTAAKIGGIWLTLDVSRCTLIPIAIKHGFSYNHAKKDYILLSYWIPKDRPSKLPDYAKHFAGVGGVVINDETDEILLVQEKVALTEDTDMWTLPGGLIDDNEYIPQAIEREVFEETCIKAKFQSIISFREKLNWRWNSADFYFICLLKPLTLEIKVDPEEIKVAKWIKIDEYLKLPNHTGYYKEIAQLVALRRIKGKDQLESISDYSLCDLASYNADEFPFGMVYRSMIAKKSDSSKEAK